MDAPLISSPELQRRLDGGDSPTLLDVRWELTTGAQPAAYAAGHIPGAAFVDLDADLSAPPGPRGRHPLPEAADFAAAMRRCGVSGGRPVVVYDGSNGMAAARAWWLLRYFGHPRVAVLDGGLAAWRAAGGELATGDEAPKAAGDFEARPGGMPVLDAAGAAALAADGVLLDARAPERYRGEVEPIDRVGGHIPGALNLPTALNVDDAGRFRDPEAIRGRLEPLSVTEDSRVGAYCGSGVSAAHEVLALELAGVRAALYPGSWSEWVADPSRPVATGPEPG